MKSNGIVERMDVRPENLFYQEHVVRYNLARKYISPKPLLDIAAGTGYGSNLLQGSTQMLVVGMDLDLPSMLDAHHSYPNPQVMFMVGSGTAIPFSTGVFGNIISMETLEHIQDDRCFLSELARVLEPDGVCIISTPNRSYSLKHEINNPYHVREYTEDELVQLLKSFFSSIQVFYQGFDQNYHNKVRSYSESIQSQKKRRNPILRWGIDHIYRPLKGRIPDSLTNLFIRKLLGLSYPQPNLTDITISAQPVEDCSNFIVVCYKK